MMRLTKVEVRRLFSRRLTAIAVLGALAITGLILFGALLNAKPISGQELTSQRAGFEQAQRSWAATGLQQVQGCLEAQAEQQKTEPKYDAGCSQMEPKWENWGKRQANFAELMPDLLEMGSYLVAFAGFVVGVGFVAAEFSSGSMGNWLTFEPRRMRVYVSKLGAVGLGIFPVAVSLLGLLTAGVWLIVGHYASTAGTTAEVWNHLGEIAGRSVALTLAAAVGGAAIGALLRHTAAVLGIAIGYLVVVEGILSRLLPGLQPWFLQLNFKAWLLHDTTYRINSCTTDNQGRYTCQEIEKVLTFGHSAAYLGVLFVFVVGLAALVFRRRDVT